MSPLEQSLNRIEQRIHRDGWIEIVLPIVTPIITRLIDQCFDSGSDMRESLPRLTFGQRVGLMQASRQIVLDSGVPIRRRVQAIRSTQSAILAEIADCEIASADDWQTAYDEATRYV